MSIKSELFIKALSTLLLIVVPILIYASIKKYITYRKMLDKRISHLEKLINDFNRNYQN